MLTPPRHGVQRIPSGMASSHSFAYCSLFLFLSSILMFLQRQPQHRGISITSFAISVLPTATASFCSTFHACTVSLSIFVAIFFLYSGLMLYSFLFNRALFSCHRAGHINGIKIWNITNSEYLSTLPLLRLIPTQLCTSKVPLECTEIY